MAIILYTYYKPMMYYKPTPLLQLSSCTGIGWVVVIYKPTTYYKPTPCSELMYGGSPMGL